jgi:hypothetical protein
VRLSAIDQKPGLRKFIYGSHAVGAFFWIPGDMGWTLSELNSPVQLVGDMWSTVYCVVAFNYWMPKTGATPDSDKPFGVFRWQELPGLRWTQHDWSETKFLKVPLGSKTAKVPLANEEAVELAFGPPIIETDGIASDMLNVYKGVGDIVAPIIRAVRG